MFCSCYFFFLLLYIIHISLQFWAACWPLKTYNLSPVYSAPAVFQNIAKTLQNGLLCSTYVCLQLYGCIHTDRGQCLKNNFSFFMDDFLIGKILHTALLLTFSLASERCEFLCLYRCVRVCVCMCVELDVYTATGVKKNVNKFGCSNSSAAAEIGSL